MFYKAAKTSKLSVENSEKNFQGFLGVSMQNYVKFVLKTS